MTLAHRSDRSPSEEGHKGQQHGKQQEPSAKKDGEVEVDAPLRIERTHGPYGGKR